MTSQPPNEETVRTISAEANPVLRNLQITHSYYLLSEAIAGRLGREANWCTFATWASKQAGSTIRNEDLARALAARLGGEESLPDVEDFLQSAARFGLRLKKHRLTGLLLETIQPERALAHSSEAVARGNRKVYAEIGREFARFIACFPDHSGPNLELFDQFIASLKPGPPPDGQALLKSAFRNYFEAMSELDPKIRSERILLANLQIGFHEQTRLQPEILEALEAPVIAPDQFTRNLIHAYYPDNTWLARVMLTLIRISGRLIGFEFFIERYLTGARRETQKLVTRTLMTIDIPPHLRLRLGDDLPGVFPSELHRVTLPGLVELLQEIDPTPDSLLDSGALFWGDLPDRIHFIADLFRSFQKSQDLFAPPFSPEQSREIASSRIPAGPL